MEKMKVFGKQLVNFTNRDGDHINGLSLHCVSDYLPSKDWIGQAYVKVWSSADSPVYEQAFKVPVGSVIQVDFDRKGKPVSIEVAK